MKSTDQSLRAAISIEIISTCPRSAAIFTAFTTAIAERLHICAICTETASSGPLSNFMSFRWATSATTSCSTAIAISFSDIKWSTAVCADMSECIIAFTDSKKRTMHLTSCDFPSWLCNHSCLASLAENTFGVCFGLLHEGLRIYTWLLVRIHLGLWSHHHIWLLHLFYFISFLKL